MVDVPGRIAEEDEVTGQQVASTHCGPSRSKDLLVRHPRDLDPGLCIRPLHETRAVESGLRARAAPEIGRSQIILRLGECRERPRACVYLRCIRDLNQLIPLT